MAWPIVEFNGEEHYKTEGTFFIPVRPTTDAAVILLKTGGGVADGFTAIEQGEPGVHSEIDEQINLTVLEPDDPTPDDASFTILQPGGSGQPQVVRLNLSIHKGEKGDPGDTILDPSDYSDYDVIPPGSVLAVNDAGDEFELVSQKHGDLYIPASVTSVSNSTGSATLCSIVIPPQDFDWRPIVHGQCIVTASGANCLVNLYARLNGETNGNIVARALSIASATPPPLVFSGVPAPGSSDTFNKVSAGAAATIYIRSTRVSGDQSYNISNSDAFFGVQVVQI